MKLQDFLTGRDKLRKYDELKRWKNGFECECVQLSVYHKSGTKTSDIIPTHIKDIIVNAIEAEIAKLDEE